MYPITRKDKPKHPVDFSEHGAIELHNWRGHHHLNGWIETLYRKKDGAEDYFRCTPVALETGDLDQLEADLKAKRVLSTGADLADALEFDGSRFLPGLIIAKADRIGRHHLNHSVGKLSPAAALRQRNRFYSPSNARSSHPIPLANLLACGK
jgi:hypothetical protein